MNLTLQWCIQWHIHIFHSIKKCFFANTTNTNKQIYILKIQGSTKVNTQTRRPTTQHTHGSMRNKNMTVEPGKTHK